MKKINIVLKQNRYRVNKVLQILDDVIYLIENGYSVTVNKMVIKK